MMRGKLIALGLGIYVLGLIATVPATFVDAGLQRASDGRLRLAAAQGTLWSGVGQFEIFDASRRVIVAKNLRWRLLPWSLLGGHLICEIELDHAAKPIPVTISLTRIELADADINLPAAVLGLGAPQLAPLELGGDLLLHIGSISIERRQLKGNATLQWHAASSTLSPVSPLGDYELHLEDAGAEMRVSLRTLQGPLQLDGNGTWVHGGKPAFLGTARIPAQHREQLTPLLRLIAFERGDGDFELRLP